MVLRSHSKDSVYKLQAGEVKQIGNCSVSERPHSRKLSLSLGRGWGGAEVRAGDGKF